jgi:hypothetical protein
MSVRGPERGARFVLERAGLDEGAARYRVAVLGGEARWEGEAVLPRDGGAVELAAFRPAEPPAWMRRTAEGLLRTLARRHAGDGAFPRRLTRWRAAER